MAEYEREYIAQLNPMEQKILQIARSHLETSFSLNKSIGFQEWQAKQAQEPQQAQQQQQDPPQAKKPLIKRKIKIKSKPS
jgi:hypothetical protein